MRWYKRNRCTPMKKINSDSTELDLIMRGKKEIQFHLNMLMGLSATCCVMLPTDGIYATLMELSAQEASFRQKAIEEAADRYDASIGGGDE